MTSSYRLGLLLVTASAIAWSSVGFFTRLIELDAATMLFWRGVAGLPGVLLFILCLERQNTVRSFLAIGWPGLLFAAVSAAGMFCFIASLTLTSVAHVSIIYATVPFVAGFLAWIFLSERPGPSAVAASAAALVGIAVTVASRGGEATLAGDLLAFAMTVSMAVLMIIARWFPSIPIMPAACASIVLSVLASLPFADLTSVPVDKLGLLAIFGLVSMVLGLALFTLGARLLPATETALIGSLDAPLAPIWVWLAFGEVPPAQTIVGGAIVFCAVLTHVAVQARPVRREVGQN